MKLDKHLQEFELQFSQIDQTNNKLNMMEKVLPT